MKTVVVVLCCVLFASQAFGQQPIQRHPGRGKIRTGAALVTAGLIVMPLRVGNGDGRYNVPLIGLGIAAAGGALIYWGVGDRRKAARPNTTIGVMLRRTAGVQIRRSW
jgi:hypothetical protein